MVLPDTARAVQTKPGWIALGQTDLPLAVTFQSQIVKSYSTECCKIDEILCNEVLNSYKGETFPSNQNVIKSESNKRASKFLQSTVELKERQYHVGLLWKNNPDLQINLTVAFKLLKVLIKCLERDPKVPAKYKKHSKKIGK